MKLAIRKGAKAEVLNDAGLSPLKLADQIGWQAGVELLKNQASLPRDNRSSRFALDANREPIRRPDLSAIPQALQSEVTNNSHANLKRVRELVTANKELVFSISSNDELAIEACAHVGNHDIIRYHLDMGAPLSLPTAVSLGDSEMIQFLLEGDPGLVHERGAHDFPVMWYAVLGGGSVGIAELLIEHGVGVDQESMGSTALHWCVTRRDPDLASFLLEHGADPQAVSYGWHQDGQTPLQLAVAKGASQMAQILKPG